jgi:hypothetical protein
VHSDLSIAVLALATNAFAFVVFGLVSLSVIVSLLLLSSRAGGSAYEEIGRGGLSSEGEHGGGAPAPAPDSPAAQAEREQEMRQMLSARSERLVRKGQPALDIDAEITRLLADEQAPATRDGALVGEVRQLVMARNERLIRQGLEPLDVDVEVARTLRELEP